MKLTFMDFLYEQGHFCDEAPKTMNEPCQSWYDLLLGTMPLHKGKYS